MYERMYKLDEVLIFFKDELEIENDERVTYLYNMISNPHVRVNDDDKQWVAYVTQQSENITVEDAMKDILKVDDLIWLMSRKKEVQDAIMEVGDLLVENKMQNKPRIPFYIMVLDRLVG